MRIVAIEAIPLAIPFTYGVDGASRSNVRQLDFCLVRVETDAGLVGWGEAFSYNCRNAVAASLRDMVAPLAVGATVGADPTEIRALHLSIQRKLHIFGRFGITAFALSGLDIALWDLAGKAAGQPVHALLGGAQCSSVPCYASLLRYGEAGLVESHAARAASEGYGEIKLHEVTEAAVAAARRAIGEDMPLTVDVNCEWSRQAALDMAKRFSEHSIKWLEEPVFPPEDFAGMRSAGQRSGVPIAAGENLCFATQFESMLEARAVAYAQPSVTKVGGITEFLRVVDACKGVEIAPHSPYFGPGALATLHLIASRLPGARFEHFYLRPEAWLYPDLFGRSEIRLPGAPGLGIDPDLEVVGRYRAD